MRPGTMGVLLWTGLWAALVLFPSAAAAQGAQAAAKSSTLEVEVEGEVIVKPDKAVLNFGILTDGAQAQEAAQANAREAEKFLAAVKKALGPEDKVKTLEYRVFPLFRSKEVLRGKEKIRTDEIVGYRASHRFRVELKDLGKIGAVADTALQHGATQVQGPFFGHSQEEELQRQAAVQALERARQLAEALAAKAGLKVSRVLRIKTSHGLRPREYLRAKAALAPAEQAQTPIEVGDITFQAQLTITFELAP